ncbi:MAG: CZB domain-containing protein [gamma proteobacterium endosymbiont of Lamellibrachia anaximandri]|nr:CZB domain-containing protein [gamma proteobacterium endosymbiont of Lamellibrachia anaximandri]
MTFSIKQKLLGIVGLLVAALSATGLYWGFVPAMIENRHGQGLEIANQLADHTLGAASHQALERGLTNALIAQFNLTGSFDSALIGKIQVHREQAGKEVQVVLGLADSISQEDWVGDAFLQQLSAFRYHQAAANKARSAIDVMLSGTGTGIDSSHWMEVMTEYIRSGARLRLDAFSAQTPEESAVQINRSIKHSIWLVSEHAGLERAQLGRATSYREPLSEAQFATLSANRAIVDEHLRLLDEDIELLLFQMEDVDQQAVESVSRADETGVALNAITESVNAITDINALIAESTEGQVTVFSTLSQNMQSNILQFSRISSMSADQTRDSSVQLGDAVGELQLFVNEYTVSGQTHNKLQAAKYAHLAGKARVRGFLDGASTLTQDEVVSHRHCGFGKWYHSADAREYMNIPEMAAIDRPHEELHQISSSSRTRAEQRRQSHFSCRLMPSPVRLSLFSKR